MTSASYTTDNNDAGTHIVTVTVSDGSLTDSQDVTVIVNDVDSTAPSIPTGFGF
jgi:PKD repeat protein